MIIESWWESPKLNSVVDNFLQYLSPIVRKQSTQDTTQILGSFLTKHIKELSKPLINLLVPGALRWWAEVGNDWSIADYISGFRKAISIGQKLAGKEPLGLKYITADLFLHNCTLPENDMNLLAPHENKHPFNFKNRHCCLISQFFYGKYISLLGVKPLQVTTRLIQQEMLPVIAAIHSVSRALRLELQGLATTCTLQHLYCLSAHLADYRAFCYKKYIHGCSFVDKCWKKPTNSEKSICGIWSRKYSSLRHEAPYGSYGIPR